MVRFYLIDDDLVINNTTKLVIFTTIVQEGLQEIYEGGVQYQPLTWSRPFYKLNHVGKY